MVAPGPPPRIDPSVYVTDWYDEFVPWLKGRREDIRRAGSRVKLARPPAPGQHWALVGKTGYGKSTFAAGVLDLRKYVFALDPKGEDETLEAAGFTRITGVPPHKPFPKEVQRALDEGRGSKVVVGLATRTRRADAANRELMEQALEYARQAGGWSLYVDEYQILADGRMYNLGTEVSRLLISARRDMLSVLTSFQAPSWVPKVATRQATIVCVWPTQDEDMIKNAARAAGRPWRRVKAILEETEQYNVLVIPDDIKAPMMIVKPPKVG